MKLKLVFWAVIIGITLTACELFQPIEVIEPIDVTSVTISSDSERLSIGNTKALTLSVLPADADDLTVTWSSSDVTIASVDTTGLVTPIKPGIATITATSNNDILVASTQNIVVGYTETFDVIGNWAEESDENRTYSIGNGTYSVKVDKHGYFYTANIFYPTSVDGSTRLFMTAPYSISVEATEAGTNYATPGIKFNYNFVSSTEYSFDYFRVTTNGYYGAEHYDSTDGWTTYVEWTESSAINTDGSMNKLAVVQNASFFTITVNDTLLSTISKTALTGKVRLGFTNSHNADEHVGSVCGSISTFDNLEVYPVN